jgi:hypothetical protein
VLSHELPVRMTYPLLPTTDHSVNGCGGGAATVAGEPTTVVVRTVLVVFCRGCARLSRCVQSGSAEKGARRGHDEDGGDDA